MEQEAQVPKPVSRDVILVPRIDRLIHSHQWSSMYFRCADVLSRSDMLSSITPEVCAAGRWSVAGRDAIVPGHDQACVPSPFLVAEDRHAR